MTIQLVAIIAIAVIVVACLFLGHDGAVAGSGFAIIGGIAGYQVGSRRGSTKTSQEKEKPTH